MHETRRWPPAPVLWILIAITFSPAVADDADMSDVGAYVLQAEMALQREDYLMAAKEYGKAAELSDDPDVARKAALVCMAYGFNREALTAAERWQQLDKNSKDARVLIGQLSFLLGDLKTAKRQYSYLLEQDETSPGDNLIMLTRFLSEGGDPKDADKLMRTLARPYEDLAKAQYAVATMALRAGDTEYAIEAASSSIEIDPDNMDYKLLYARALLTDGQTDKAIEYTARIIGDDPDPSPDARMELAIMYMMADREDDALSQVSQVLLEQPNRMGALRLMAVINFHQGNLDVAWDDFHDLLESGEYRMDALYYLGRIADYRSEYDRAIRFYSAVHQGSNALSSQQRAASLLVHEDDDVEGAMLLLDAFAKESPSNAVSVQVVKAQILASVDEHDAALKLYDKALKYRPDNEGAALSRAELLVNMGDLDAALGAYDAAAKRWPKSAMTLNAYGYTLADKTDRYRDAEKLIRKALRYEPDSPAIIDSLGWVLFKLGDYEDALVELERAYVGMRDHEVAAHIVETLIALDREEEALERLVAAEELTPDSPLLLEVRERLFTDAP